MSWLYIACKYKNPKYRKTSWTEDLFSTQNAEEVRSYKKPYTSTKAYSFPQFKSQ